MPYIYRCHLTLKEPTFFSSREVSNYYQTAPLIGNYALAYSLGLCQSPYFNDGTIHYREHLTQLNEQGIYVTPATISGEPQFTLSQFNAQPDAYWYAMGAGTIVTRPDGGQVVGGGKTWRVVREDGRRTKIPAENRPQHGRIRFLALGNEAIFYLISEDPYRPPAYIRLGKFMSKARLNIEEVEGTTTVELEQVSISFLLNPADLGQQTTLHTFDLINVPPMPLVKNSMLSGSFFRLARDGYLPAGMHFGVDKL